VVMDYVPGRPLKEYARQVQLKPRKAAALVAELAQAVGYVHRHGIVHQDITPRNVLIDQHGRPRLIDFGLVRLNQPWSEGSSDPWGGTVSYMAPEQVTARVQGRTDLIGPWTDLYALGGILHFLLTGWAPHQAGSFEALVQEIQDAPEAVSRPDEPGVPRALSDLCAKALQPEPDQRFRSAEELEHALRRYLLRPRVFAVFGSTLALLLMMMVALASAKLFRPVPVLAPLDVVSFYVEHYRGERPTIHLGTLGIDSDAAHQEDDVRIHARLSEPAYCYLLALNTDGSIQLRYPKQEDTKPGQTAEVVYPVDPLDYFGLTDGSGLQAFLMVAARRPLPPFRDWRQSVDLPWERDDDPETVETVGVWRYDGRWYEPKLVTQRGTERRRASPPRPFARVCDSLKNRPEVDAIHAIAFPVQPPKIEFDIRPGPAPGA